MAPTCPAAVPSVGSPGGDTIPSTVTQVIRNLIDHRMTVDQAVERGRIHHQYLPDEIRSEQPRPLRPEVARALERRGHTLKPRRTLMGGANSIVFDAATGRAYGWSDTRKGGLALAAP